MMPCARCGAEPDADMVRYSTQEGDDELSNLLLCPSCSYGLNMLVAAYVANRDVTVPSA